MLPYHIIALLAVLYILVGYFVFLCVYTFVEDKVPTYKDVVNHVNENGPINIGIIIVGWPALLVYFFLYVLIFKGLLKSGVTVIISKITAVFSHIIRTYKNIKDNK